MSTAEACKHVQQYGESVEFPIAASLEHFDECFTPECRLEAYEWMRERSEVGTRCLMASHIEERALAQTATRLGYELGRKEALDLFLQGMSLGEDWQIEDPRISYVDVQIDKDLHQVLQEARNAASGPIAGPTWHSGLPEGGEGL